MLDKIGRKVEKHPYLIILITILVTLGFVINIPSMNMNTSTEDFMPDSDIANASSRVTEYFGKNQDVVMILTEHESQKNILTASNIRDLHDITLRLSEHEDIEGIIGFTNFIEMICGMEFNTTIENSTDEQIITVLQDILTDPSFQQHQLFTNNDDNEDYDYSRFPRISKGRVFDGGDIKNAYVQQHKNAITFTIEVYDLSGLEEELKKPLFPLNVMEWSIAFSNQIGPKELQEIDYRIAVHLEPKHELWTIGNGFLSNINNLISQLKQRELRNTFNTSIALWISPPGIDTSFPIQLKHIEPSFDTQKNTISWTVNRTDLGTFGIAPENDGFGLPARLGNFTASFRYYQLPLFHLPWLRINTEMETVQNIMEFLQRRPFLSQISSSILKDFDSFSWEQFDEMGAMLSKNDTIQDISLTSIESWWVTADVAPDTGVSEETIFIKPQFMDDLRTSTLTFLPKHYEYGEEVTQTLILAFINGSIPEEERKNIVEAFNEEINTIEQSSAFTLRTAGNTQLSIEIDEIAMSSNQIIMPSIFIAILILLFITFRKISYMFLPLIGLSLSIIWVFGSMVLLGINFNMMYVALVPLMLGLGVDYSVHMFHNYRAELSNGKTVKEAIILSIQEIGTALFLATITTVIAFLSFLTATIQPIKDLGLLSALGIIFTFIITLTFLSATRYILDRKKSPKKMKTTLFSLEPSLKKLSILLIRHSKIVIIISVLISVLMGFAALQVQTSFDMESMLPQDNPTVEVFDVIGAEFPSSGMDQEYILIEGDIATTHVLQDMRKTVRNIYDNDYIAMKPTGEPKIESIISIIDSAVEKNMSLQSTYNLNSYNIPSSDSDTYEFLNYLYTHETYQEEIKNVLHKEDDSFDATVVRIYTNSETNGDSNQVGSGKGQRLYEQLTADISGMESVDVTITGMETLMFVTAQSLTTSQINSTVICIILAAIVLIIVFRNLMLSLLTLLPVLLSISWILGTMYIIGLDLNIMTVMITSITIGLGVTYAIHAVQRFRLIADETGDIDKAVSSTVSHTGGALLASAATTVAGFGILILAPITPQQQFGFIASITIVYSLLTTILVLPPLLKVWAEWRKKHKGFIISDPKKK